jgi:hypothetical protein
MLEAVRAEHAHPLLLPPTPAQYICALLRLGRSGGRPPRDHDWKRGHMARIAVIIGSTRLERVGEKPAPWIADRLAGRSISHSRTCG